MNRLFKFVFVFSLFSNGAQAGLSMVSYPEFDHAVLIKSVLTNGNTGFCSGVVLNPTTVLTAAHCIDGNSKHRIQVPGRFFTKWVFSNEPSKSSDYHPDQSKSDADIGILTFTEKLPFPPLVVCKRTHVSETLYRIGFGGRDGKNLRKTFELQAKEITNRGAQKALDEQSVSGDSGGPVFAVEENRTCLYAIHSSLGLESTPKISFNPVIRKTSLPMTIE